MLRKRESELTLREVADRWGKSLDTVRNWIYRQKLLKPLPSSRCEKNARRGLRFSLAEVKRFERTYRVGRRARAS